MESVNLDALSKHMEISDNARFMLEHSEKKIIYTLTVRVSEDRILAADCYVVYHNTARGPAKGGIRLSPHVTLEETTDLAERMTWKTALVKLPFGGGKSGIVIDPGTMTLFERINVFHEYVHIMQTDLLSGVYVPAPDLGSTARDMAIIYGETHRLDSVTGKPPRVGGLPGRLEATGRGVAHAVRMGLNKFLKKPIEGATVAVQGFGNVGGWTARFLSDWGARVVAVSDATSGIYDGKGIDVDRLRAFVVTHGELKDAAGEKISNKELLGLKVDCLVPAAVENVLTTDTAGDVKAPLVVEGANGPTTPVADKILADKGVKVVPDILANAGGVIASYIEWRKAKSGSITGKQEVFDAIEELIGSTFEEVCATAEEKNISCRTAAQVAAVSEVISAMHDRGWL